MLCVYYILSLARQAAIPPPRYSVTAGAFAVGVLVSARYRRNRCENDIEMLYNNTRDLMKKALKSCGNQPKTAQNR